MIAETLGSPASAAAFETRLSPLNTLSIESPTIKFQAQANPAFRNPSLLGTIRFPHGSVSLISKPANNPPIVDVSICPDLTLFGVSLKVFPLKNGNFKSSATFPFLTGKWTYCYSSADQDSSVKVAFSKSIQNVKLTSEATVSPSRPIAIELTANYCGLVAKFTKPPDEPPYGRVTLAYSRFGFEIISDFFSGATLSAKYAHPRATALAAAVIEGPKVRQYEICAETAPFQAWKGKLSFASSGSFFWNGMSFIPYLQQKVRLNAQQVSFLIGGCLTGGGYVAVELPKIGKCTTTATLVVPSPTAQWLLGVNVSLTP
jgi:hypothetical protein